MVKVANLKKKLVSMGSTRQVAGSAKKDRPVQLWINDHGKNEFFCNFSVLIGIQVVVATDDLGSQTKSQTCLLT